MRFHLLCRAHFFVAGALLVSCTSVLGIDGDYYVPPSGGPGAGGTTTATSATTMTSANGGSGGNLANGEPCGEAAECQSGHCVDDVCCAEACDGACQSCSAGMDVDAGLCAPFAPLTDPEMECGADQTCDGMGSCFTCNLRPAPPGQMSCPPECTGGCTGANECLINCDAVSCGSQAVVCPADYACIVACNGTDACNGSIISCPDTYACRVECDGNRACDGATVTCSASGVCELACESGAQVCEGTSLACGNEACLASCGASTQPNVSCGGACHCQPC